MTEGNIIRTDRKKNSCFVSITTEFKIRKMEATLQWLPLLMLIGPVKLLGNQR